jgi:NADH:ubiquinone oxidoreductase subunit 2 (subunit N)
MMGYVRVVQLVFFGDFNEALPRHHRRDHDRQGGVVLLGVWLVVIGVFPQVLSNMVEAGMRPIETILKFPGG